MAASTASGSLTVAVIAVPSTGEPLIATDSVSVGLSPTAADAVLVPLSALPAASVNEAVTVSGLDEGTHYFFRVTGHNAGGDSEPSNIADAATTLIDADDESFGILGVNAI